MIEKIGMKLDKNSITQEEMGRFLKMRVRFLKTSNERKKMKNSSLKRRSTPLPTQWTRLGWKSRDLNVKLIVNFV